MRKVIDKKTACRVVVMLLAFIAILSVFPFRIWTKVNSFSAGGTRLDEKEFVNIEYSVSQKFVTQYDRLSSIDIYVTDVEKGRYISATLMDKYYGVLFKAYVDTDQYELPGYVTIPFEYDIEVGEEYYLYLDGCRSKYSVAYEDVPADSAYVGGLYRNGEEVPARHLAAVYNYRLPISKTLSLEIIAGVAALAIALFLIIGLYYGKRTDKNTLVTVRQTIKVVANPIIALFFGTLMIMVFPLRIFDMRVADIIFYELGLIISATIAFYAVNHKSVRHEVGVSFWDTVPGHNKVVYILIMFSMAMALWYACEYMNDLYDIYHTLSERRMLIWLLVMMVLTLSYSELVNIYNVVWVLGSAIYGIHYYKVNALAETEKEYDLHNMILKYGIIIVILCGVLVLNLIRLIVELFKRITSKSQHSEKPIYKLSSYGLLVLLFLASIIITRNTRWWGVALAVTFTCLYIRLSVWKNRADWIKIVSGGLMMNFAISLIFSLLHRYFAGYVSGRFGFLFHTVTVTAEYFTFMGAVAAVLLTAKVVALPKHIGAKEVIKSAWKEIVMFGWSSSYAIFTVSRTAYLALSVCIFLVLVVTAMRHKKEFFRMLAVMIVAVILCFPAAFTLQRIIPAVVAKPVVYPIDDTDEFIRGGAAWDSPNFMCVERFANLFASKILGVDVGDYDYPTDYYNYDVNGTGDPYFDIYGNDFEGSDEQEEKYGLIDHSDSLYLLCSAAMTKAEMGILMLSEEVNEYVDSSNIIDVLSNGRITIFKSYFKELNLFGHEEMGAELPNGEIAVHAHNTYLQVAYDHGIIVGIIFIMFILCGLISGISFYRNMKNEPLALVPFAVIIGFAVAGISEWVFMFSNPMTIALMLTIAPLLYKKAK